MVPASGAASRMFKDIFAFINGKTEKPDTDFIRLFFDKIEKFAFFPSLKPCGCVPAPCGTPAVPWGGVRSRDRRFR